MSRIDAAGMSQLQLMEATDTSRTLRNSDGRAGSAKVAQDFEGIFSSMMLKEMRQGLEPDSLFGKDSGDIFGGLFDRFMGEEMTKGQGLGLASFIREGIDRQQRAADHSQHHAAVATAPTPAMATTRKASDAAQKISAE